MTEPEAKHEQTGKILMAVSPLGSGYVANAVFDTNSNTANKC